MAYSLTQISKGFAAEAAVAGLLTAMFPNPGTFAAAAARAIVSIGCNMVANSITFHNGNTNYGVTLNLHWLPITYYEVTENGSIQY